MLSSLTRERLAVPQRFESCFFLPWSGEVGNDAPVIMIAECVKCDNSEGVYVVDTL